MARREQPVQSAIIKHLTKRGAYVIKTIISNRSGVPDIIACYKGKFLGLEVKAPDLVHTATELQLHNIESINNANGIGAIVTSVDEAENILAKVDKEL